MGDESKAILHNLFTNALILYKNIPYITQRIRRREKLVLEQKKDFQI